MTENELGENLYKKYQQHHIDEVPKWESLSVNDQLAWRALAEEIIFEDGFLR